MARFVRMIANSGVYSDENFMVVPHGGFNLVNLLDGKDYHLDYDDKRLGVKEVSFEEVNHIANEYVSKRLMTGPYELKGDLIGGLRNSMNFNLASPGRRSRVLKVTAKGGGLPVLKATHGDITIKLDIGILRRKDCTVAYKYLRQPDQSGNMIAATKQNPSYAPQWLQKLNWIYGAQANIGFILSEAEWFDVKPVLGQPLTSDVFLRHIVKHKSQSADLTCFLVGRYKGSNHAAGEYFDQEEACVLDDAPSPEIFGDDCGAFIGVMAHEFAHFLGGAHHKRGPILMSEDIETCSFDKQLVVQLSNW